MRFRALRPRAHNLEANAPGSTYRRHSAGTATLNSSANSIKAAHVVEPAGHRPLVPKTSSSQQHVHSDLAAGT